MITNPALPQGTRDFDPDTVRKRNYIFDVIRTVFELYGFQPLETPAMENLETLMGKYGEEGDKLIFKILNNGLGDQKNISRSKEAFEQVLLGKNDKNLTQRALKYDLTIPFARYVAMNYGQLQFPFRRYQIQPVWRADRPQKGRYREFYQCDADVVGSKALINEVELALMYNEVFSRLKMAGFSVNINNRKILKGIMEVSGVIKKEKLILGIIDKTDKIGFEGVKGELLNLGIEPVNLEKLLSAYSMNGSDHVKLSFLKQFLSGSETGLNGVSELEYVYEMISRSASGIQSAIHFDFTLARGLEYYTGIIFEVKAPARVKMGSIGGGGRYDDLTGLFGVPDIPGVGISFGVDRIYDVLEELDLFPRHVHDGTRVIFFFMGEEESRQAFGLMQQLRVKGVKSEMYHEQAKLDKQFRYATKKNIPYAVIIGNKEMEDRTCVLKDLRNGEQKSLTIEELLDVEF